MYTSNQLLKHFANHLRKLGINICTIFCLDSAFFQEQSKYISGYLLSVTSMGQMELPHVTVLTKCVLLEDKYLLEKMDVFNLKELNNRVE